MPHSSCIPTVSTSSSPLPQPDDALRSTATTTQHRSHIQKADLLVAGSLAIDFSCDFAPSGSRSTETSPSPHTSNPAIISQGLGGVGHNVALAASYVGSSTLFCSAVADDLSGKAALAALEKENLSADGIQTLSPSLGARTAQYVAVNDAKKDLVLAMADMKIMELPVHVHDFDGFWDPLMDRTRPSWVVVDANWSPGMLSKWIESAHKIGARVAFEPVSTAKARGLFGKLEGGKTVIGPADTVPNHKVNLAAPNELELASLYNTARENGLFDSTGWWNVIDALGLSSSGSRDRLVSLTSTALVDDGIPQQSIQLLPFIPYMLTTLGRHGVLLTQLLQPDDPRLTSPESAPYILSRSHDGGAVVGGVYMRLFHPDTVLADQDVISVNGAGDTLLGVVVAGLAIQSPTTQPKHLEDIIPVAQKASLRTLQSPDSVSIDIKGLSKLLK